MQPHDSLPDAWINSLFARLQVRYGAAWLRMWEGVDITAVKADWAQELGGFAIHPDGIKHGLNNLPADRPPTVAQFVALCQRRPDPKMPALPAPVTDSAIVAAVKKVIGPKSDTDPKAWAHALRRREQMCERLSITQRAMWRAALKSELEVAA